MPVLCLPGAEFDAWEVSVAAAVRDVMGSSSVAFRVARAKTFLDLSLLALLCLALFGWRLGRLPLIDPDEPFYALTSREMLNAHDWVTPRIFGHPQFEKPPMVYWLVMLSTRAFGQGEAAARLPTALSAAALVLAVYVFGAKQFGRRTALPAAVVLATGLEFLIMARMLLTDMMFALFICLSCFAFWLGAHDPTRRRRWWMGAGLACGFAVITKGPLGLLVPSLAAALAWIRNDAPRRGHGGALLGGLGLFAAVAVPWYAIMTQ